MDRLIAIEALGDNFIYLYRYEDGKAFVVDPSEGNKVFDVLNRYGLTLTTIFLTHGHFDHTAGVPELKKQTAAVVIAGGATKANRMAADGDTIEVGKEKITVIGTPGHTQESVCYYLEPSGNAGEGIVWTGDTLFVAGCGRIMNSDAPTMYESLCRLAQLPDETLVCCGHNYTIEDYEFALTLEPENAILKELSEKVKHGPRNQAGISTIGQEKRTNPFLRADQQEIRAALCMADEPAWKVFAEVRRRKDFF